MKHTPPFHINRSSHRGQSLVEVALFFPIFIIMVAGLVEVANLLVTQNRVTSAARAATRFAANGGENAGIDDVLLNTVTDTLKLEEDVWDVWVVRGTVNEAGDAIMQNTWEFEHIYGISSTQAYSEVNETNLQTQVLEQLQRDEFGNNTNPAIAGNVRFVGTYAIHDVDSILGLNAVPQLVGFTSVRELTVMRITGSSNVATNGCDGFPIIVYEGIRSVTPPGSGGAFPFPNQGDFDTGQGSNTYVPPTYAQMIHHVDDIPLLNAQEGYVFRVWNGAQPGNFGWLRWNEGLLGSTQNLDGTLEWPGNSKNYFNYPNGDPDRPLGQAVPGSGYDWPVWGYIEWGDPTDQEMNIDDWVMGNTGVSGASYLEETLVGHINGGRHLRLIVWNQTNNLNGDNLAYHISGFVVFRLLGYNLQQGWILGEFIRWDNTCGQLLTGP